MGICQFLAHVPVGLEVATHIWDKPAECHSFAEGRGSGGDCCQQVGTDVLQLVFTLLLICHINSVG